MDKQHSYLLKEGAPRLLVEGLKTYGTYEFPGAKSNPVIMAWAEETKAKGFTADSIPWCGLWMAVVAKRAGWTVPGNPLWALNWANFGQGVKKAMLGDILVFKREGGGHVGLYVGEDTSYYHVLGGNQSDNVNVTRIAKARAYAIRRPKWKIAQPPNVRQIFVGPTGPISTNEA